MIVFDVSSLIGAAIRHDGVPQQALRHALGKDTLAISHAIQAELVEVLDRPKLARFISAANKAWLLHSVITEAVRFEPTMVVNACRDPDDNKYLELAWSVGAEVIVSSDQDLLVLDPWQGIRILTPAGYLTHITPAAR